jgi:hypothetical protein
LPAAKFVAGNTLMDGSNEVLKIKSFKLIPLLGICLSLTCHAEFVDLQANKISAYVACNSTGEFGLKESVAPDTEKNTNSSCAVVNDLLLASPMNAPLAGFNMVGMISRGIAPPAPEGNDSEEFATLTDTIWWNKDTKECIFGTHVLMKEPKLSNGEQWEINDIVRGGFVGRPVSVAYFMNPNPNASYGMPEALYRAGRSMTSVKQAGLPDLNTAPYDDGWVDFTTDVNFADPDGTTRKMTAMLYIKSHCDSKEPEEKEGAIRLRTTGQNGQKTLEVVVPGLVPAGASLN